MDIVELPDSLSPSYPHLALTIGSFDGVHRGHLRILETLVSRARESAGTAAVMTMRPHPRELFSPSHAPNLLTTHEKKLELLAEAGVDAVFVLAFSERIANLDREDFVQDFICSFCHAEELIVGHDFRFGKDALGDYHFLLDTGAQRGFRVTEVPPLFVRGERVSSTGIRECLLEGDLEGAEEFLGRRYSIVGEVISGRGIGTTLGYPTANIRPHHSAIPATGVYIAEARLPQSGAQCPAAVNIGVAPTIRHQDTTIEAFLLGFEGNIRGEHIEITFHKRLRPERKFPSHEALIEAIENDVKITQDYFHN